VKLVVIVPAFRAARHLPEVLGRLTAAAPAPGMQVVVVDDGSDDDTAQVAERVTEQLSRDRAAEDVRLTVLRRPRNGGYGAAMKDGLGFARAAGATHAASVHADGQYSPEALRALLAALDERRLDLLQGSRIAGGAALSGGMPLYKYVGNFLLNQAERRVFGLPLTDFHSGYLVYGPRALAAIPFDRLGDSFHFDMEVIASARARSLAVGEAPIPTHYGDEISHLNPLTYGLRVLRVMWRYKLGAYNV